jgi:hypothetical protein
MYRFIVKNTHELNILPVSGQVLPAKRFGLRQPTVSDAVRQAEGRLPADRNIPNNVFVGGRFSSKRHWPVGFGLTPFPRAVNSTSVGYRCTLLERFLFHPAPKLGGTEHSKAESNFNRAKVAR